MAHSDSRPRTRAGKRATSSNPREQTDRRLSPKVRWMLRTRALAAEQVPGTGTHGRITPADVAAAGEFAAPAPSLRAARARGDDRQTALASPLVRRLLRDADLAATEVTGTGPGGRVTRDDARRAVAAMQQGAQPRSPSPADAAPTPGTAGDTRRSHERSETVALTRIRRTIAERMHRSLQTSAQLTAAVEVDMTRLMTQRRRARPTFEQRTGLALSPFPLIASAVCEVLARHPALNARIDTEAGTATYFRDVHLGVAVDTERGLVVPTIPSAQQLDVTGLTRRIAEVAGRAREQQLRPDDMTEGTFTLTNTGSRGVLLDTPILNPPQVAILATTMIEKRPVVLTDDFGAEALAIRQMSYLCLTYDHRLVDGADAARFLRDVKQRLETTEVLAEFAD